MCHPSQASSTSATWHVRDAADALRADGTVDFPVDGEMQADTALVDDILEGTYDFAERSLAEEKAVGAEDRRQSQDPPEKG